MKLRRSVFAWMVRLHPAAFRVRFGDEMLAVYDDAEGAPGLLRDAAGSLMRQWLLRDPQPVAVGMFAPVGAAPGLSAARLAIGGLVAFALFSGMVLSLGDARRTGFIIGSFHPRSPLVLGIDRESTEAARTKVRIRAAAPEPLEAMARAYFRIVAPLAAIDRNGDRILDANELAHAPPTLAMLDRNGDGFLDAQECGQRLGPRGVTAKEQAAAMIWNFDRNRDGVLTPEEAPEPMRWMFHRGADAKALSGAAIERLVEGPMAAFARRGGEGFFKLHPALRLLDADGDLRISMDEIAGAARALRRLDHNGDGALSIAELRPDALDNEAALILKLDVNFDGRIAPDERSTPLGIHYNEFLDQADEDGDGTVTAAELRKALLGSLDVNHDGRLEWLEVRKARALAQARLASQQRRARGGGDQQHRCGFRRGHERRHPESNRVAAGIRDVHRKRQDHRLAARQRRAVERDDARRVLRHEPLRSIAVDRRIEMREIEIQRIAGDGIAGRV